MEATIIGHSRKEFGANAASRLAFGVNRRDYVTITFGDKSVSKRVYRIPSSTSRLLTVANISSAIFVSDGVLKDLGVASGAHVNVESGQVFNRETKKTPTPAKGASESLETTTVSTTAVGSFAERIRNAIQAHYQVGESFTTQALAEHVGCKPGKLWDTLNREVNKGNLSRSYSDAAESNVYSRT